MMPNLISVIGLAMVFSLKVTPNMNWWVEVVEEATIGRVPQS
jgi:hypothetical protein